MEITNSKVLLQQMRNYCKRDIVDKAEAQDILYKLNQLEAQEIVWRKEIELKYQKIKEKENK